MLLKDVYNDYRKVADQVNWKQMNVNDLFFEQIKHEKDELGDVYFAAIVRRFWGYAGRIYTQCNKHVSFDECYDCIIDSIRYVLKKRVWENEDSTLYGDHSAPDKAMHIAMKRQKGIMLSKFTTQKRQSNFNTLSIDGAKEEYNDSAEGLLFGIETSNDSRMKSFISEYFEKENYLDGIFLDCICFNSENIDYKSIIREARSLTKNSYDYFSNNYNNIDEKMFYSIIRKISNTSNRTLEIKLKSLLFTLKEEGLFEC